jgi:phosphoribosyl-ATP pyrophosphohydrolase
MSADPLERLAITIRSRRTAVPDGSYTRQLLDAGPARAAKKFGEEAVEFAIAAASGTTTEVSSEAADVLYHLLVVLESRGVEWRDVTAVLEQRTARSGLAEKAARTDGGGT